MVKWISHRLLIGGDFSEILYSHEKKGGPDIVKIKWICLEKLLTIAV